MPLFGRRGREATDEATLNAQASLDSLVAGGLPLYAHGRLSLAKVFTGDLSVGDFALARLGGVAPVAQVTGSSVYHVGWQRSPGSSWSAQAGTQELTTVSHAWNEARRLAFDRLRQEAVLAGGHAVVGLKVQIGAHDWLAGAIEYLLSGTAVRDPELGEGETVLTSLSFADYRQLRLAGYRPTGLHGSSGVFYVVSSWGQQMAQSGWGSWSNQELPEFTQGLYDAREVVLERVSQEAARGGAGGLIGVGINYGVREVETDRRGSSRTDLIVSMHVLGTAIVEHEPSAPGPQARVALDLGRERPANHILGGAA
jgi:uncharacterized protein YbjQ (UPF0145 family)